MHQALKVQEIIIAIFSHLSARKVINQRGPESTSDARVLAALARTCRAFKEPALDILWRVLVCSSPLARCLPDASRYSPKKKVYVFWRRPTQTERNVLQSYTRRIWSIESLEEGLDWASVKTFLKPPAEPLFPNLRKLHFAYEQDMALLQIPLPSLVELSATFSQLKKYPGFLKSLPETSPNIRSLSLEISMHDDVFDSLVSSLVCRWQNLDRLVCTTIFLDKDALVHVSRMPALTELDLDLRTVSIPSFVFRNLNKISIRFQVAEEMLGLLRQAQFPVVTSFYSSVDSCRAVDYSPLLAALPTSIATHTLQRLELETWNDDDARFGFAHLKPCMLFSHLRHLKLNVGCHVDLTESHILTLASAWSKLEFLSINQEYGWRRHRGTGITPGGLIQLLQTCRSLTCVRLLVNTRGYTQVPESHVPASLGLTFPSLEIIDVIDSAIEKESIAAMTTFISGIAACTATRFSLRFGPSEGEANDNHYYRWHDVVSRLLSSGAMW